MTKCVCGHPVEAHRHELAENTRCKRCRCGAYDWHRWQHIVGWLVVILLCLIIAFGAAWLIQMLLEMRSV